MMSNILARESFANKLEEFITNWLPPQLKWRVMSYLLSCDSFRNIPSELEREQNYCFSVNSSKKSQQFTTGKDKYLYYYFPFENDETQNTKFYPCPDYWEKRFNLSWCHNTMTKIFKIKKRTRTVLTESNIKRIKEKQNDDNPYWEPFDNSLHGPVDFRTIDLKNVTHIEYQNHTEIQECKQGTIWSQTQNIIMLYSSYTGGTLGQKFVYNHRSEHPLDISPLQMLWQIKNKVPTIDELKLLAKINKIKHRKKLKTYKHYLDAFMKL